MPISRDTGRSRPIPSLQRMGRYLDRELHAFSRRVNSRAARMRHDTLLFLGAVIACAWGAACIAIICQGLRDPPVAVPPPAASAHLPLPRSATEGDAALVRAHVGRLTDYLDSLRARDPSRYQRLSAARPGLFDSLNEIQHILSPQNP